MHMIPDNPGEWQLADRVYDNLVSGTVARYTVLKDCGNASSVQPMNGQKRWYYIAAVEETWDYAPSGKDLIEGVDLKDSPYVLLCLLVHLLLLLLFLARYNKNKKTNPFFIYQLLWTQACPKGMCPSRTQVPCEVPSLPNPTSDVGSFTSNKNRSVKVL